MKQGFDDLSSSKTMDRSQWFDPSVAFDKRDELYKLMYRLKFNETFPNLKLYENK